MTKPDDPFTPEEREQAQRNARLLAGSIEWSINGVGLGIVSGVVLQIVELFLIAPAAANPARSALIALLWLYGFFVLNGCALLGVWARARYHFRETFALGSLFAIVLGFLIASITLYSGFVPWEMSAPIAALMQGQKVAQPALVPANFALVIASLAIVSLGVNNAHARWTGRISRAQALRDDGGNRPNLLSEAVLELLRRIRREPALEAYIEPNQQIKLNLPAEPIESLAWADQARDLVCLTSPSYSLRPRISSPNLAERDQRINNDTTQPAPPHNDDDHDWHDLPKLWIGQNKRTKQAVALIPIATTIDQAQLNKQIAYAHDRAWQHDQTLAEVIIAVREGQTPPPICPPQQIPLRIETEHTLLEQIINLDDYRTSIKQRIERNLPNTHLKLRDIYIPMRGNVPKQAAPVDVETYIQAWLTEPGRRHLALLGSYGQGKSTIALMLTHRLLTAHPDLPPRIPILIELRGRNLQNMNPYALLGQWAGIYGLNGNALVRLHDAGRLLLIFEGFDEMAYLSDHEMRMNYFRALWEFARYPNAKILISGRPNLFETQNERDQALNFRTAFGAGAYCEPISLELLAPQEITDALRSYPEKTRTAICTLADTNKTFYDIVSRPSLLQLVATNWEEPEMQAITSAPTSAQVMHAFVHSTHRRQTEKEAHTGEFMKLTEAERVYFMAGVALFMLTKHETTISTRQLAELTDQLRIAMPDAISQAPTPLTDPPQPLRIRIRNQRTGEGDPALIERIKTEVRTSSLLESEPSAPSTLKFGHKSFLEYIFAEEISQALLKPDEPRTRALLKVSGAQIDSILRQPEAFDFFVELLIAGISNAKMAADQLATAPDQEQQEIAHQILGYIIQSPKWLLLRRLLFFITVLSSQLILSPSLSSLPFSSVLLGLLGLLVFSLLFLVQSSFLSLLVLILSSVLPSFLLSVFSLKVTLRLILWLRICKKIGLRDHVFYAETGTAIIPWLRGKPFPFLRDPRPTIASDQQS